MPPSHSPSFGSAKVAMGGLSVAGLSTPSGEADPLWPGTSWLIHARFAGWLTLLFLVVHISPLPKIMTFGVQKKNHHNADRCGFQNAGLAVKVGS